jgi:cytochrome c oxidase subunit IV
VAHEVNPTESGNAEHHGHGAGRYFIVWILLLIFTALTVYTGHYHPNIVLALVIATTKATLVVLFFMHVKYTSEKMTKTVIMCAIFWLGLLLILSLADFATRATG